MRLAEAAEVDAMWSFVERSAPGWLEKSCLLTFSIRLYDSSPYLHRGGDYALLVKGWVGGQTS
jgi:hypothetical protein